MVVKRTVFLVEDEQDIRSLVRFHLEQDGYAVREAESGEEALRVVLAERPALVLLDLMLPGIDGFEVCRRLRHGSLHRAGPDHHPHGPLRRGGSRPRARVRR